MCQPARKTVMNTSGVSTILGQTPKGLWIYACTLSCVRNLERLFVVNLPRAAGGGKPILPSFEMFLYIHDFWRIILQCVLVWSWGLTTVGSSPAPLSFCAQINRTIRASSDDSPRFLGIEGSSHSVLPSSFHQSLGPLTYFQFPHSSEVTQRIVLNLGLMVEGADVQKRMKTFFKFMSRCWDN